MRKHSNTKKKNKKRKSNLRKIQSIIFILIIVIIICFIKQRIKNEIEIEENINLKSQIFENVENEIAEVSEYIVYGTHLNLEGTLTIPETQEKTIENVEMIIKNSNENETSIYTEYSIDNNIISFSTGETINEGIDLEELEQFSYYLLLKIEYDDTQSQYYSLCNASTYGNIEYYTITKNSKNNKIYINFSEYNSIQYLNLEVTEVSQLPDDVYDVVIDAGHGGIDVGAVYGNYYESEIVLDCAKELKSMLEDIGLKVFLTRDGTEDEDADMAYNMYDDDGRITLAMESNAKILISLHMNSNEEKLTVGGVEVYSPSNANLSFAKLLADNIVTMANTTYSYLETYKEDDGVYVHNFSESEIISARKSALSIGYQPYNITTSTPYLFMIRETGGIATNAFVDGRNTNYSANKYYNSNVGIESYLIELGYIIVNKDLNNILNNKDLYMQAIANSIEEYYLST